MILLFISTDGPEIDYIDFDLKTAPNVDPPVFQLTCTSSTAPATTVQWSKDGSPVSGGSSSQIVINRVHAAYINELTVTGRQSGTYMCNVTTCKAYSAGASTVDSFTIYGKSTAYNFFSYDPIILNMYSFSHSHWSHCCSRRPHVCHSLLDSKWHSDWILDILCFSWWRGQWKCWSYYWYLSHTGQPTE